MSVTPTLTHIDHKYTQTLQMLYYSDNELDDRTGVGISELFGVVSLHLHDTANTFPVLALKRTNYDAAIDEMRWMLSGSTNVNDLSSSIWNEWADEHGDLGPTYGAQLRAFRHDGHTVDQVARFMVGLVQSPTSRRHLITLVHPGDEAEQALPPCISLVQGRVISGHLHLAVYQRSADWFLGVPFDVVGWTYFQHLMAAWAQLKPGNIHFHYGSAHLYRNHRPQAREVLNRYNRLNDPDFDTGPINPSTPRLRLHHVRPHSTRVTEADAQSWLSRLQETSYSVSGYQSLPGIKAPVAV